MRVGFISPQRSCRLIPQSQPTGQIVVLILGEYCRWVQARACVCKYFSVHIFFFMLQCDHVDPNSLSLIPISFSMRLYKMPLVFSGIIKCPIFIILKKKILFFIFIVNNFSERINRRNSLSINKTAQNPIYT